MKLISNKKSSDNNSNVLPKTLLGFYFKYGLKNYKLLVYSWAILFTIIVAANGTLFPLFQRWFIALFEKQIPAGQTFINFALPTIIMIVVIWIIVDTSDLIRSILAGRWKPKVQNEISEVLNNYVHSQSMSFWTGRMSGKINSQINYISGGFFVIENILRMSGAGLIILINVGLVLGINPKVAIVLGTVFLFRLVYSILLMKPMAKASKSAADSSSSLSGKVVDSISNYYIVKLFAGTKSEEKHLKEPRNKNIKDRIHSTFIQRFFWGIPMYVWDISFGFTMMLCVMLFSSGDMKISEIVFTLSVYFSVMGAIGNIVSQIPDTVDVISSAQQSYKELIKPLDIVDAENAKDLKLKNGLIEIKNITFKYKTKKVLDNLSLTIHPGEKVGLVGSSGAGKTTLVNLMMRFYDPINGEILIDGQNIRDVKQDSLRKNISFIPQEPSMFNRTLRENISYGNENATDKEIRSAAKKAQADKFIMASEKKYDSMIGERGIKLSGGQRQRIAIARAFLKSSPILILDEATSALDSETESAIQESFKDLAQGRTTIVIAHRLSTLQNMDKIVVIDNGKIVEQGTHNSLLKKKKGVYAKLWKMQSGGFIKE